MLEYALSAGLTSSGCDAYILHVTTTPSVSFITRTEGFDCGIMISASHNPYFDNGIKIMNDRGEKAEEEIIKVIEDYLDGNIDIPYASGVNIGKNIDYVAGRNRYIGHLIALSKCSYKGLKVGLDLANGSAFTIAKSLFDALGAKTFIIGDTPNGLNINDKVGSTNIDKLAKLVKNNMLDIGFAFDGDADRCIAVDEKGGILSGDEQIYICANRLKELGELVENQVVITKMSNGGLIKSLKNKGITCSVCEVGDKNVYDQMLKTKASIGGERSGHIVFSKYESTGDGLVTAIMIMEAIVENKCSVSSLLKGYTPCPQILENVQVKSKDKIYPQIEKFAMNESADDIKILIRKSGTEPIIRVLVEGEDMQKCSQISQKICKRIVELEGKTCAE